MSTFKKPKRSFRMRKTSDSSDSSSDSEANNEYDAFALFSLTKILSVVATYQYISLHLPVWIIGGPQALLPKGYSK